MKRKTKEIVLLLLPVAALALVVPGARWLADKRESDKVPRITSLNLRAPPPLEYYLGADAGFEAKLVAPETKDSDHFMNLRMEIRNEIGQIWNSEKKNWDQVTRNGRITFPQKGSSELWKIESGLQWKKVAGAGKTVSINVVFEEQTTANTQVFSRASRVFKLTNDLPAKPKLNRSNFVVKRVDLVSQMAQRDIENENEHKFILTIQSDSVSSNSDLPTSWTETWQLSAKNGEKTQLDFRALRGEPDPNPNPVNDTSMQLELSLLEYLPARRGRSCRISGFISIAQGWSQQINIELPQGFPAQLPYERSNLPFTTQIAPLPK